MRIYFKGGDTDDITNFNPEVLPSRDDQDVVVFDQTTTDVLCKIMPNWYGLDMTNFKADIYYQFAEFHQSGVFRNSNKYDLFSYISHIQRID